MEKILDKECPVLDKNYYESLSSVSEPLEDEMPFSELELDMPKEEKHKLKQIDLSFMKDLMSNEEKAEQEKKKLYTFEDMVAEVLTDHIVELGKKFVLRTKFDMSYETIRRSIKPLTFDEKETFLNKLNKLPAKNELYTFRLCNLGRIPEFARREFVELFLEYKNTAKESVPTEKSLNYARDLLGLRHHKLTAADKKVLKIRDEGIYQYDDVYYVYSGDYDLDMLYSAAVSEYYDHKITAFCKFDDDDPLNKAVILIDYLCRHDEVVAMLEKLKTLRFKIRQKMHLPDDEYVGF